MTASKADIQISPTGCCEQMPESPAEIAERIFRNGPHHSIRDLKCRFHDGVLTIAGDLPSFYLKQVAQTAVQRLDGVERIDNRVEVSS